jgi:hypothetical protein
MQVVHYSYPTLLGTNDVHSATVLTSSDASWVNVFIYTKLAVAAPLTVLPAWYASYEFPTI